MKKKNEPLKQIDLENLVKGATFLASGGGGTYDSAMLFVQNFTKKHYERTEVSIIDVDDIPENDSKCAIVLAYLGTPTKLKDAVTPRCGYPVGQYNPRRTQEKRERTRLYRAN